MRASECKEYTKEVIWIDDFFLTSDPSFFNPRPQILTGVVYCIHINTSMLSDHLRKAIRLVRTDKALKVCFLVDSPTFPTPSKNWMAAGSTVYWRLTINC